MHDDQTLQQRLEQLGRRLGAPASLVDDVMKRMNEQAKFSSIRKRFAEQRVMHCCTVAAIGAMIAGIWIVDFGGAFTVRLPIVGAIEKVYVTLALLVGVVSLVVPSLGEQLRTTHVSAFRRRLILMAEIGVVLGLLLANVAPFAITSMS